MAANISPMKATDPGQWWIAWDRAKHTLTWKYGSITGPFHPVDIWGLRYYAAHNFCQVFPRIRRREWDHLLNKVRSAHVAVWGQACPADGREVMPSSMVAASTEFYQVVTEDVFGKEPRKLEAEVLGEPVFQFTVSREDKCVLFSWGWETNLKNVIYIQWLVFHWHWPFVRYIEGFTSREN